MTSGRSWWLWTLAGTLLLLGPSGTRTQTDASAAGPATSSAAQAETVRTAKPARRAVLGQLRPLADGVPRTIRNPYYAEPEWKLWSEDPSPVVLDRPGVQGTFAPVPQKDRKYPTFPATWVSGLPPLAASADPAVAGFWDDAYMSLDNYHTNLFTPAGQFIPAGKCAHEGDPATRLDLGVNFTSQSYAQRGRHIVDDTFNNLNTEKFFFFANCIRATPAHMSFCDNNPDKADDSYDGLFGHSFQSIGQSRSEMYALTKMMYAGASMPRKTKDLLKRNGAYAIVLLTLFKAALPYVDAAGQPLPYEHELRHRPAYSSCGTPQHPHFCSANVPFHSYDDDLHIRAMIDLARAMTETPPITIVKIESLTVLKPDGSKLESRDVADHVKGLSLTNVRLWGSKGETLVATVNLKSSYDLAGKPLTFTCQRVYANQKNVTVKETLPGMFTVTVQYDPKLPKGRIPVICVARNGTAVPGNPAFVNFYYAAENEEDDYSSRPPVRGGKRQLPVNINLRPKVDLGLVGDIVRCKPGETVSVALKATDPEGFAVSVCRWPGQVGTISGSTFTYTAPTDAKPDVHWVNLNFIDGTGGGTGKRMGVVVRGGDDHLAAGWSTGPLGSTTVLGNVRQDGSRLIFAGQPPAAPKAAWPQGCLAFREAPGAIDAAIRLPADARGAPLGIMIRQDLDPSTQHLRLGWEDGELRGTIIASVHYASRCSARADEAVVAGQPVILRVAWRNNSGATFVSADGKTWRQVVGSRFDLPPTRYVGASYAGGDAQASCEWLDSPGEPLPIIVPLGSPPDAKTGRYGLPLKLEIVPPEKGMIVRYTLDGSAPTAQSPAYDKQIEVAEAGRREIRAAVFTGDTPQATVIAVYDISPPEAKKK